MTIQHKTLAEGQWRHYTFMEQMGNIGSEISRAILWRGRDKNLYAQAFNRAIELLDLTIQDACGQARLQRLSDSDSGQGRLKELARAREILCDAFLGGKEYGSSLDEIDQYFFHFARAARRNI